RWTTLFDYDITVKEFTKTRHQYPPELFLVGATIIWLFLYIHWCLFFVTTDAFWRPLTDLRDLVDPIVPRRLRSLAQLRPLISDRYRVYPSRPLRSKMVSLFWWLDLQHRVL